MKRSCLLVLVLMMLLLFSSCGTSGSESKRYQSDGYVGQTMEDLKKTNRKKPKVSNEGLEKYPVYNEVFDGDENLKQKISAENESLVASSSTYDSMDQDGNLFLEGVPTGKKLYKHTASFGLYGGDVKDSESAVVRKITITPRSLGNYITGLYAPAGEVIEVSVSKEDLKKTGGFSIEIGNVSNRGHLNTIPLDRDFTRMPNIINKMKIQEESEKTYVGSFFGGPIYLGEPANKGKTYTVTIKGAVPYSYFILGQTTEEEFDRYRTSSAPFFDLEVWDDGIRHSGPHSQVADYSYEDCYQAARLWEKIADLSNRVPSASANTGIAMRYDTYVPAGAAVAFVGANFCVLPVDWMRGSLNYEEMVSSGMWGTIHEFNHHFQGYGAPDGGEVTNNAVSLLEYVLYTDISSYRTLDETSLSWWNRYTNPQFALKEVLNASEDQPNYTLSSYAVLIHCFGVDTFLKAISLQKKSSDADEWYQAFCLASGYDLTYFFETLCHFPLKESSKEAIRLKNLKPFLPIASVFQSKLNYVSMEKTVRPFRIPYQSAYSMNLDENLILPQGCSFEIQSILPPKNGTVDLENHVLTYRPKGYCKEADDFDVVLRISSPVGTVSCSLTFSLVQTENKVEVTTYSYSPEKLYPNLAVAEANEFSGYDQKETSVQTDTLLNNLEANTITVANTKVHLEEAGKYRFYLRGRDAMVFLRLGSEKKDVLSMYTNGSFNQFSNVTESSYYEIEIRRPTDVYLKELSLAKSDGVFAEVGYAKEFNGTFTPQRISEHLLVPVSESYEKTIFETENHYPKEYTFGGTVLDSDLFQVVQTENFIPWSTDYREDKIFDGNLSTYLHTQNAVNENSSVSLLVDLKKTEVFDYLKIYGRNQKQESHVPISFALYLGTDLNDMELYQVYENLPVEETSVTVWFEKEVKARYYRLVITETQSQRYLAIAQIDVGIYFPFSELLSMNREEVVFDGNWDSSCRNFSPFGFVNFSKKGTLTFHFSGTAIGILGYATADSEMTIRIDDGKKEKIRLNKEDDLQVLFRHLNLENKEHQIEIDIADSHVLYAGFAVQQ